ncbi:MAG: prepilin-type N-terminal cleavage/methylation domain-containing protein [Candidatus Doudnabacteria bacterium]|nr:prepilin-type N-terminal cleavage/methylation domain-containing protein [Candidatus Doudnabacteria bacterium]
MLNKAKARRQGKSAFTLVEILVVIAIIAILAVVAFVALNPAQRINDANDAKRREDVQAVLNAIALYAVDNSGNLPTAGSQPLPLVTNANIMTAGVAVNTLDGISPTYLTTFPADPAGTQYRVGVLANGAAAVGASLSDASLFVRSQ